MYSTCKLSPVVRYTNTVIDNLLHDCEENIIYMKIYSHENISRGQHSAIKPGKCTSIIRCTIHGHLVNIGPVINISRQVINISRQSQLCFRALSERPEKMRLITFEVFSRALSERPENCDCIKIVQKILNNTPTA